MNILQVFLHLSRWNWRKMLSLLLLQEFDSEYRLKSNLVLLFLNSLTVQSDTIIWKFFKIAIFFIFIDLKTGDWNVNGCSYVPDLLLNQVWLIFHPIIFARQGVYNSDYKIAIASKSTYRLKTVLLYHLITCCLSKWNWLRIAVVLFNLILIYHIFHFFISSFSY